VECKLRCVNFRRVSDPRRAFLLAFRVTAISDDGYRSTMGVIVIGLGTPWSPGDKPGSTCDNSGSAGNESGSASNHSRAVGKNTIFLGNAAGAPGNHSYYLSFNDF